MNLPPESATHGLLLFAHGARDPAWAQPFHAVHERVRGLAPGVPVALAFLEFMPPTLPEAADALVAQGCRHLSVVPLFLGAGGHVRKDVPVLLEQVRQRHPQLAVTLRDSAGASPAVVSALAHVALSALDTQDTERQSVE